MAAFKKKPMTYETVLSQISKSATVRHQFSLFNLVKAFFLIQLYILKFPLNKLRRLLKQ